MGSSIVRRLIRASLALVFALGTVQAGAAAPASSAELPASVAEPGQVIVEYRRADPAGSITRTAQRSVSGRLRRATADGRFELISLPEGASVTEAIAKLEQQPGVAHAQPNYRYAPAAVPDDPQYAAQWALNNPGGGGALTDADIDAPEAWETTTGSSDVVIAFLDTGVDLGHADLRNRIWTNPDEIADDGIDNDGNGYVDDMHGWDFFEDDAYPFCAPGSLVGYHGAHVAGIAAAEGNNAVGITGVAWDARIMPLRFMDATGGDTMDALLGVEYAAAEGADIVNASFGGGAFDPAFKSAIENSGLLFVASAGNNRRNNDTTPYYPASYEAPNVIAVAATNSRDERDTRYSNYGPTSVDLAAPGTTITATLPAWTVRPEDFVTLDAWSSTGAPGWDLDSTQIPTSTFDPQLGRSTAEAPWAAALGYGNNQTTVLERTVPIDASSATSIYLEFAAFDDMEPYVMGAEPGSDKGEKLVVWATDDGVAWYEIGQLPSAYPELWVNYQADLSWLVGPSTTALSFRFEFVSDGSINSANGYRGVAIDDVSIWTSSPAGSYAELTGTSMAAPHVSGVAALLLAAQPSLTATELKQVLMATVDPLPTLDGRCVTGGRVNAAKAVSLVSSSTVTSPTVVRVADADRYSTAVQIARTGFPEWAGVTDVVIASGEDRAAADPLAAAGLCWAYDAPLLLVSSSSTPQSVLAAMSEIASASAGPVTIHVVGGTSSVPDARIADIYSHVGAAELTSERVLATGGRYDLAAAVAARMQSVAAADPDKSMPSVALVANGADSTKFFDALALSAISAHIGAPVLLVSATSVPAPTASALASLNPATVVVGGGTSTVSEAVRIAVEGERWAGSTRYSTAAAIATKAQAAGWLDRRTVGGLAAKLPDALAGGGMIGRAGGPLLLTTPSPLSAETAAFYAAYPSTVETAYAFGGVNSIAPSTLTQLTQALTQ